MLNNERLNLQKIQDENDCNEAFNCFLSSLGIPSPKNETNLKDSILRILSYFKREIPKIPENITDVNLQMEYIFEYSGIMKRRIELVGKWWKDCSGCILARKKNGEVIPLIPSKWGRYHYTNNQQKHIKINHKNACDFEIDAFCFYDSFPLESLEIVDLVKFISKNLDYMDIVFVSLSCLVAQILGMMTTYITNVMYNVLIPSGSISFLWMIFFTYFGITVGKISFKILKKISLFKIQSRLNLSVQSAMMIRIFNLPTNFFKDYSSGDLASRVSYINYLCRETSNILFSTLISSFFSLGYIFQLYLQSSKMFYPAVLSIFVSTLFSSLIIFLKKKINRKKIDLRPKLQSLLFSIFSGIQKIKLSGSEKRVFAIWAKKSSEIKKLEYDIPLIIKISNVIEFFITSLTTIILYFVSSKNSVPVANYISFYFAFGILNNSIFSLNNAISKYFDMQPVFDLIKPFLKSKPEISNKGKIIDSLSGEIELNKISFRYKKDSDFILNDLSLKIKRGEYVAIVGKTGCGKSTIFRLLLGFETPERGSIYFDKFDISTLDKRSLRQNIGVVMQNSSLFQGDIYSNIVVTSPWKTIDDAWEAAKLAGLDKDIENMPMGMHTLISEGSGGLSGGQKQRIMIARALISKPKILLFDEATSALDNITQRIVSRNIDRIGCTRIVIAHRLSTVKNCTRILVLNDGKIVEEGNFDSLMNIKGLFYELAINQSL